MPSSVAVQCKNVGRRSRELCLQGSQRRPRAYMRMLPATATFKLSMSPTSCTPTEPIIPVRSAREARQARDTGPAQKHHIPEAHRGSEGEAAFCRMSGDTCVRAITARQFTCLPRVKPQQQGCVAGALANRPSAALSMAPGRGAKGPQQSTRVREEGSPAHCPCAPSSVLFHRPPTHTQTRS